MRNLLLIFIFLNLVGCGAETRTDSDSKREMVHESHTTTKTVTRETPLENGGRVVETITTTDVTGGERSTTASQERSHTGADAGTASLINGFGTIAGAAVSAATGNPSGTLIGTGIAGLLTAAVSAWGAAKSAESKQLRQERDWHKEDAKDGWDSFKRSKGEA